MLIDDYLQKLVKDEIDLKQAVDEMINPNFVMKTVSRLGTATKATQDSDNKNNSNVVKKTANHLNNWNEKFGAKK